MEVSIKSCFLLMGLRLSGPKAYDFPLCKELVDEFLSAHGIWKIHWLIMDRGYLDGEWICHLKTDVRLTLLFLSVYLGIDCPWPS
jgi:hypothetical protein